MEISLLIPCGEGLHSSSLQHCPGLLLSPHFVSLHAGEPVLGTMPLSLRVSSIDLDSVVLPPPPSWVQRSAPLFSHSPRTSSHPAFPGKFRNWELPSSRPVVTLGGSHGFSFGCIHLHTFSGELMETGPHCPPPTVVEMLSPSCLGTYPSPRGASSDPLQRRGREGENNPQTDPPLPTSLSCRQVEVKNLPAIFSERWGDIIWL